MDAPLYIKKRIEDAVPALAWREQSLPEMRRWQSRVRTRLRRLLGLPQHGCALNARVQDVRRLDGYTRETVVFESRPGLEGFGYFLLPDSCKSPGPAVLCVPGHGRGVDSIVGIAEDGSQRRLGEPDEIQADFALQCVAHGYPTFAIEQISFGHRRDQEAREDGPGASSCTRDSSAALMLGETMVGWRVWDAIRALDYMAERPEVDPKRIAMMGMSGGGTTTLYTACLDTRVQTAVVSGYFNTFRGSILSLNHCIDNYAPGLLQVIEMPDLAGLVAPRPFFVESGTDDPIFPVGSFKLAVARAREIYSAFGCPEHFDFEIFPGEHIFHGKTAFEFLRSVLPAESS